MPLLSFASNRDLCVAIFKVIAMHLHFHFKENYLVTIAGSCHTCFCLLEKIKVDCIDVIDIQDLQIL